MKKPRAFYRRSPRTDKGIPYFLSCIDWREWYNLLAVADKEFQLAASDPAIEGANHGCSFCIHRVHQLLEGKCGAFRFTETA